MTDRTRQSATGGAARFAGRGLILSALLTLALLGACGQKGELTLPEANPALVTPVEPAEEADGASDETEADDEATDDDERAGADGAGDATSP